LVVGAGLGDDTIETAARVAREEIATGSGWVASAEYRSHLVEVLVARCLQDVRERLTR
jgi:CO/xanthine dehydrogenase FAD-binding subunit